RVCEGPRICAESTQLREPGEGCEAKRLALPLPPLSNDQDLQGRMGNRLDALLAALVDVGDDGGLADERGVLRKGALHEIGEGIGLEVGADVLVDRDADALAAVPADTWCQVDRELATVRV